MQIKPAYEDDALLSVAEAAAFLDVHADTVRRWADSGLLPVSRTPTNHRRFRAADLKAALTSTTPSSDTSARAS